MRLWLTPKADPEFEAKCEGICRVYSRALKDAEEVRTLSVDEMTSIQALERAAPSLPMKPGKVERCEFEYIRHGTQTLIAGFNVATGKVEAVVGDSRKEEDFAAFLPPAILTATPRQARTQRPIEGTHPSHR